MADSARARCHCGGVEIVAGFPSRFCAHCYRRFCGRCGTRLTFESEHGNWADEVHLPLALFVTPVDRAPSVNSFPEERPDWAPFHAFD